MAVATDGHATPNGNGNGALKAPSRTPPRPTPSSTKAKKRGVLPWSFGIVARCLTWYCIVTVLFRCPSGLDACDENSPPVCAPYFRLKNTVAPHLTPYYDTYAAPYVDLARPYYDTVDRHAITPAYTYAAKYGSPRIYQAQNYTLSQWEKNVQPQLLKYQDLAYDKYRVVVSPHVNKATTVLAPYYDVTKTNAQQTYHDFLLPAYLVVQPYALQGYNAAHAFTADTAIPTTLWAWNKTYVFLDSAVWPQVRNVYVAKVEPQLVRIGERLGRYNDKKSKTPLDEAEAEASAIKSTFARPASSITSAASSVASSISSEYAASETPEPIKVDIDEEPPAQVKLDRNSSPESREEVRKLAAQTVADDLKLWETKFSQVVDEGASEIENSIDEIASRLIEQNANVKGKALVELLESTVRNEIDQLRSKIVSIIEKNKDNAPEEADQEVASAVRAAGSAIKDKAQDVRAWRQDYEQDTETAVTNAAQDHFAILEKTRDLALQKIGMKWAWMDGVTYKHWQEYHQLKGKFEEWTRDLKLLITSHPGLTASQNAGTQLEDEAMGIAQGAAEELGAIKQVAAWKAIAGDFTDNFDQEAMRQAAQATQEKIAEAKAEAERKAAEAEKQAAEEAEKQAAEEAELAAQASQSAAATESEPETTSDPEAEPVSADEESDAPEVITVTNTDEAVTVTLAEVPDEGTSPLPPLDSLSAEPTESASDLDDGDSEASLDEPEEVRVPAKETPVKSALFGAAAQSVPTRQPILDEDEVLSSASSVASVVQSDVPASITSAARAAYTAALAQAADHYSGAMSAVSIQVSGQPKPAHEEMFSSVSDAYFDAIATANSRLNEAVTAASHGVYGTPTTKWMPDMPTMPSVDWEKVQSIAQQNLQDSVEWANSQYESAKVAIGAAEPTPSTFLEGAEKRAEKMLDQARHNYYAGLGLAHARYSEFISVASTAVSSMTATPTPTNLQESASSAASVASESAAEYVSAASEAAESLASAASDAASGAGESVGESWDMLVSRVSSQVYGAPTPTPWYQDLYSAAGDYASVAGDYAAAASEAAEDQISSATSVAGEYAGSATDAASSQYSVVSSLVSELVVGKEPTFTESVYSRLAVAYSSQSASAASLANAATQTAASAASDVTDAAESAAKVAAERISSATDKIKEAAENVRDEL